MIERSSAQTSKKTKRSIASAEGGRGRGGEWEDGGGFKSGHHERAAKNPCWWLLPRRGPAVVEGDDHRGKGPTWQ